MFGAGASAMVDDMATDKKRGGRYDDDKGHRGEMSDCIKIGSTYSVHLMIWRRDWWHRRKSDKLTNTTSRVASC